MLFYFCIIIVLSFLCTVMETYRLMEKYELSDNTLMLKGFCVGSLFYGVALRVLSSLAIILLRKRAGCFTLTVFLLLYGCQCSVPLPPCAIGWCVLCDCGISWPRGYQTFWCSTQLSMKFQMLIKT